MIRDKSQKPSKVHTKRKHNPITPQCSLSYQACVARTRRRQDADADAHHDAVDGERDAVHRECSRAPRLARGAAREARTPSEANRDREQGRDEGCDDRVRRDRHAWTGTSRRSIVRRCVELFSTTCAVARAGRGEERGERGRNRRRSPGGSDTDIERFDWRGWWIRRHRASIRVTEVAVNSIKRWNE